MISSEIELGPQIPNASCRVASRACASPPIPGRPPPATPYSGRAQQSRPEIRVGWWADTSLPADTADINCILCAPHRATRLTSCITPYSYAAIGRRTGRARAHRLPSTHPKHRPPPIDGPPPRRPGPRSTATGQAGFRTVHEMSLSNSSSAGIARSSRTPVLALWNAVLIRDPGGTVVHSGRSSQSRSRNL